MFNLIFSAMQAYNQIGMFIAALVCLGIGGLLLGSDLYWRVHSHRVTGTIIGVIANGNMYTAVYRYTLSDGQTHEAKADMSTGWMRGYETGRSLPLLVSAHNPNEARSANNYIFLVIGLVFALPGLFLAHTALTAFPVTPMTWIVAGAMLLYFIERAIRVLRPKGERISLEEWRKQHNLSGTTAVDLTQVKPIEQIAAASESEKAQADQQKKNRWVIPVMVVMAVVLVGAGIYQAQRISRLESDGLRAQGTVVRLAEESSSGGHDYYPVVRYRTAGKANVEFKDSIGGNPPLLRPGDTVTVLYLAEDPKASAIIDRGVWWNWAMPAILVAVGGLMLVLAVGMRSGTRPHAGTGMEKIFTPYTDVSSSRPAAP